MSLDCSRFKSIRYEDIAAQVRIDAERKVRRAQARLVLSTSHDPIDRRAVQLAEAGYGTLFIHNSTGIELADARRLVTGE
jgi:hypothetical protein